MPGDPNFGRLNAKRTASRNRRLWKDPKWRKKRIESQRAVGTKHMKEMWKDPVFRRKRIRSLSELPPYKRTKAHRLKMSKAKTGKKLSKAHKLALSKAWTGYELTPRLKKLFSEKAKKQWERQKKTVTGICEICRHRRFLCKDHDHKTGKDRGNICHACNTSIGMFRDSIRRLTNAIKYLRKYQ